MPDAEVIPIGAGGRPGRGSGRRTTPSAAARGLAPAAPPARRRTATRRAATSPPPVSVVDDAAAPPAQPAVGPGDPTSPPGAGVAGRVAAATSGPAGRRTPLAQQPVEALATVITQVAREVFGPDADDRAAAALSFLRRRLTGDYSVDVFGFDADLTESVVLPLLRPLYQRWFRVDVRGIEHVPSTGGALLVANHSGTIPIDSLMTQVAVHDDHPGRRNLRMLGADLVYTLPVIGEMGRKTGSTLACTEDAERLLAAGELVGVWPEGFKGVGKPFSERYKLQRFGRGGFVAAALRTGAPIIPCSIVGAEEIYPMLGNLSTLARLLGVPYLPITPTFPWLGPLGLLPLPSKWIIEFGEPIPTDGFPDGAADDPMLVFNLTDQVRETIQHTLYALLVQRRSIFF